MREEYNLSQQELADKIGVSRQTIYYLEKGSYNPSLTISFKIAEVFDDKRLKEIFYQEPVLKDILKNKTLEELDRIASEVGITTQKLIQLNKISDDQLNESYTKNELEKIAKNSIPIIMIYSKNRIFMNP